MKKTDHLLLWTIGSVLFVVLLMFIASIFLGVFVLFTPEKHTYTLDEIGQVIHTSIPKNATDIQYSSEMHRGYFIKLSFNAPHASADQFAANLCQGIFYEGYDPFNASNSYVGHVGDVLLKAGGYAYFSASSGVKKSIYGNRCPIEDRAWQIKIDKTDPQEYAVRLETLTYTCDVDIMCSAPYGFEGAYRPLPKDSPIPLRIYGFEENAPTLKGQLVCTETDPGAFQDWNKPPFKLNDFKGASFELFVDDTSQGQAKISDQGRLKVDYSSGHFVGLHESPEYCFQVDATTGRHQMSIDVKSVAGKSYRYSWDFRVQ